MTQWRVCLFAVALILSAGAHIAVASFWQEVPKAGVDAVEGRNPLFDCKEIRANCILYQEMPRPASLSRSVCGIHAVMLQAEQEMRRSLACCSLADIAAGVADKVPARQREATGNWFATRAAHRLSGRRSSKNKEKK